MDEVLKALASESKGLSQEKIDDFLIKFGQNKIPSQKLTSWQIFLRQFKSPFVYLLLISFFILIWLGEKLDAFMILFFIGVNSLLGFYQEYKSETAVSLLKKYLISKVKVRRDGIEENVDTSFLVPGDVLILEPGDIIPADVRFIKTTNLVVDESVLTGESQPVQKFAEAVKGEVNSIYDAVNIGFTGTVVVSGKAEAVVFATGVNTDYAKIVKLTGGIERESGFEKELLRFSTFTLVVVLATLIFVVVTSIAVKPNPSFIELLMFSIALAVSVIPEALPVVITFSLSLGALSLAKKSVVVKRLSAIEDLGSLQVLCSDKTGTLTENNLSVLDINSKDSKDCLLKANLASVDFALSRNVQNNAFDIALKEKLEAFEKFREKRITEGFERVVEVPFDPQRRRVTVIVKRKRSTVSKHDIGSFFREQILITRGAPEEVLKLCRISYQKKEKFFNWAKEKGREGKRVLAVAEKILNQDMALKLKGNINNLDIPRLENDMRFLGFITFSDPIKKSAYQAISQAKKMGIAVKILTGDSLEVAESVARKVGLLSENEKAISGSDFEALSISEKHKAVENFCVFARVTPSQKYDMIKLLQEKYYTGFLGEGINDAPALKIANVAIVVSEASDVAREASDIVLLKRDLKVIIDGILGGRRVFDNTSKYITATMASNFGNFFAVALITPFINFLPMLPLQILLVNLLSDFPMIAVATDNVDEDDIKIPKRYDLKGFATKSLSFGAVSSVFDFVIFGYFVGMGEKSLQTYWFIQSILSELLFLFVIRTQKPIWKEKAASKPLIYLTLVVICLTLIIPFTTLGDELFGFIRPKIKGIVLVFVIVGIYLLVNEIIKFVLFSLRSKNSVENNF